MAVQIETQGQLQEFLGILKRRKWQVLLPASIVIALAIAVAVIVPKKYVARTQIELRQVGVSISTKEGGSAVFQIRSPARIQRVLKERQHAEFLALPADEQGDFVKRVGSNIKVIPGTGTQGTQFIAIEYMDVNRDWAKEFLLALRQDWIFDVLDRDRRKAQDEEGKLLEERGKLERELKDETAKISELKLKHGLSATQPAAGSGVARNEDPLFERLSRAQSDLDATQREILTLQARRDKLQTQHDEMPGYLPRESVVEGSSNELDLQDVEKQIDAIREKMSNMKPAHSGYTKYSMELEKLDARRTELRARRTEASLETTQVENPDRKPLGLQIAAVDVDIAARKAAATRLKDDIERFTERSKELQDVYREINDRQGKAGRLEGALSELEKKYFAQVAQVEILSSPEANPFTIQEDVDAGQKPTEPNPWLIASFGLVLGLGLGLAIALVAEFSRNCFRSVADISRVMVVPVLGSIGTILTRRQRRITALRRAVVGLSSVVLVGAILWVTWAWASNAQLLSQDLRDAIEELRTQLK